MINEKAPRTNHPVHPENPVKKELRQDEHDLQDISELTRDVIGCAFTIHNTLGFGFLESVYEVHLVNYLTATGIEHGLLINFGPEKVEVKRKFKTYRKTKQNPAKR